MLFKMRCLFFSKAGNAEHIAQQIARTHKTTSDQIPPAYPSESEKLLFIGVEANGAGVDKKVMLSPPAKCGQMAGSPILL